MFVAWRGKIKPLPWGEL